MYRGPEKEHYGRPHERLFSAKRIRAYHMTPFQGGVQTEDVWAGLGKSTIDVLAAVAL
jgi:hypothetical protein